MAKQTNISTLSPLQFASARDVLAEDAIEVLEQLNWSFSRRPVVHVSMATGPTAWAGGSEVASLSLYFIEEDVWVERLRFKIVVPPETLTLIFGAQCVFAAGQEGQIRVAVGSPADVDAGTAPRVVLPTFTSSTADEQIDTLATSVTGTGELDVQVELNHTVGSSSGNYMRNFRCEEEMIPAANLADPEDA